MTPTAGSPQEPAAQPQGQDSLEQQRRRALVARYLEVADRLRLEGSLEAAVDQLTRAKALAPTDERIVNMLAAVQAEMGVPVGGSIDYHTEQVRLQQIAEQRGRSLVEEKLQTARDRMAEKDYRTAVAELRHAQQIIVTNDRMDWSGLPSRVTALLQDAEQGLGEQDRRRQSDYNDEVTQRLAEERRASEARRRAKMDLLLHQAQLAFRDRKFQRAHKLALEAKTEDPSSAIAQDMIRAAAKAAREQASEDYYNQKAREIRTMLERHEELKIPQMEVLKLDASTWERAMHRAGTTATADPMDPQDQGVWDKVNSVDVGKLTYTKDSGDYNEVVKHLWRITDVPIIVTPKGREAISSEGLAMEIELVESLKLKNFLDIMVQRSANLAWTVRSGVVIMGEKSEASGTIVNEVYDVKDLVFKRTEFTPPHIRDIPGTDSGDEEEPRAGGEKDEKVSYIEIADLVTNVKDATDPAIWEGDSGFSINSEDAGYLVVKASPEYQRKVALVLSDMRRFATPVVTIDSKFLTVTRNFLQEVGVDFRGLGGAGNKGATASLDDVTSGLGNNSSRGVDNGGTGDAAANPLAGAFFNDGGDGDVRGRTENFFTSGLGRALTPNGGLTASWAYIGDTQFNMIMRAVEKQEEAEVVNSQILSVLNRGRGHVAVINQTAYVRDFDVEVAQASFIADPKVDVIQDGIVLDVHPVIQMDRKYIILNLSPTIAELTRPIPTFTTSLAGSTLPVTLQLPNLLVTSFATTARVPDGGTVLLGGLRQILTKERRAEVPLFARLPLLSFFFKQEGAADENRNLMVMVRAWITDVRDLETR